MTVEEMYYDLVENHYCCRFNTPIPYGKYKIVGLELEHDDALYAVCARKITFRIEPDDIFLVPKLYEAVEKE